jgi:hypothetical protein
MSEITHRSVLECEVIKKHIGEEDDSADKPVKPEYPYCAK